MKRSLACMGILLFSVSMSNGMHKRKNKFNVINSETAAKSKQEEQKENFGIFLKRWEEKGENVDSVDNNGNTILHLAVFSEDPPYWVHQFKDHASENVLNNAGDAPIHLAVRDIAVELGIEISKILHDAGADINLDSPSGTPLAIARLQRKQPLIELLESYGAVNNNIDYRKPKTDFRKFFLITGMIAGMGYYLYTMVKKKATPKIN